MFNAERSGVFAEGVVRVHLRRWLEDDDAWTLARYICSPLMQGEVSELYRNLQVYQINSVSLIPQPDQVLRCGFPFAGPTTLQGVFLALRRFEYKVDQTRTSDCANEIRPSRGSVRSVFSAARRPPARTAVGVGGLLGGGHARTAEPPVALGP
jgi:hypothetical protein